jgi:hypothetical protein
LFEYLLFLISFYRSHKNIFSLHQPTIKKRIMAFERLIEFRMNKLIFRIKKIAKMMRLNVYEIISIPLMQRI